MTLNPTELKDAKTTIGNIKLGVIHSFQKGDEYNKIITNTMNKFVNGNGGEARLEKYIMDELPKQLVKFYIKIYESSRDAAKEVIDIDTLFAPITSFLTTNSAVAISKDNSLIKSIEEGVYTYFKKVFELYIPALKKIVDNFNNYLMNESKQLEILTLLLEQAEKEDMIKVIS
jgi:hypothetical protein